MKKIICAFLMLYLANISYGQYSSYEIKEHYDAILDLIVDPDIIKDLQPDNNNGDYLGDGVSFVLSSFLKMYSTTGDKAYLNRFISWSYNIQMVRNDINNSSNHPGWGNPPYFLYLDGLIIKSMAEYVFMIRNNTSLANTQLPSASLLDIDILNYPNLYPTSSLISPYSFTYGGYASWLGMKLEETLDWYISNGYWVDSYGFRQVTSVNYAIEMNKSVGMALTLYYMGYSDPNYYYQDKVDKLVDFYRGNSPCTSDPVFEQQQNDSYFWKHRGWSSNCSSTIDEDISHGIIDMLFPLVLYNSIYGFDFTEAEMIYWHNTFSENVYDAGHFHNSVTGGDNNVTPTSLSTIDELKMRALAWMPFYEFDAVANTTNVYEDIVMPFYTDEIYTGNSPIEYGLDYFGLSEVVSAQWEKECVNLTFFNRYLVYDQDFYVKNNLKIAPKEDFSISNILYYDAGVTNPFADPITFPYGEPKDQFIVESGINVNMSAGSSIELLPGFEAKAGSNFRAFIDPALSCNNKKHTTHATNSSNSSNLNEIKKMEIKEESSFSIIPNPTTGIFTIQFLKEIPVNFELQVINMFGAVVYETKINNYPSTKIDVSNLPTGLYYIKVRNDEINYSEKLLLVP